MTESNAEPRPLIVGPETPASPYPIRMKGEVVKGFGRGSKELGIPTANLSEDAIDALCKGVSTGIYYGWAQVVGKGGENDFPTTPVYPMVMSLGWNPYYKNEKQSAEIHIIHVFQSDFYNEELRVIVLGYIRPESDYNSLEELIQDINTDIQVAHNSLKRDGYSRFQRDGFFVDSESTWHSIPTYDIYMTDHPELWLSLDSQDQCITCAHSVCVAWESAVSRITREDLAFFNVSHPDQEFRKVL
ncbi:5397_t:CDS:2 [Ambispora gerdemannii]|uniref:Riboflavin kinase n=1 Tax=Ambispora gerdemannii TaxID=144530 RepID=A0A9N9A5N1_9GLOM|nr:5397_t:CDS:2 [Ambispora gerdemannii]